MRLERIRVLQRKRNRRREVKDESPLTFKIITAKLWAGSRQA